MPPDPPDRKFYKYMKADTAKKVLEKSSLRWALPKLFNDPFDVQFDLRVGYDRERVIARWKISWIFIWAGGIYRRTPTSSP
jgi:hypothetical protein